MKELKVGVKFNPGELVYTTIMEDKFEACDLCDSDGIIVVKGNTIDCPNCRGKGKIRLNQKVNVACADQMTITSLTLKVTSAPIGVKYSLKSPKGQGYSRNSTGVFATYEEAVVRAEYLNLERKQIPIDSIVIPEAFKNSYPSPSKIKAKMDYYEKYKQFENDIRVNNENVLVDGYITYLLYKLLGNTNVKVIVQNV